MALFAPWLWLPIFYGTFGQWFWCEMFCFCTPNYFFWVFEVATAFSFTAGHLCMFRTVWTWNSLELVLQREAGCPGVLSLESWISGGFNFCFTLQFLLTLQLAELWHPGVISSEHSSVYFKVASILSLVQVLMFMNRYDRKMAYNLTSEPMEKVEYGCYILGKAMLLLKSIPFQGLDPVMNVVLGIKLHRS